MARKKASFSSFLFGVLFGIILVIGSVAAGGYWAYNNLTIGHIESLTNQNFEFIAAESELRTKAIKDYITEFKGIPELTFSEFTQQYGINFPSDISFITDALHDQQIKNIKNFPTAIMERVKLGYIFGSPYNDFETYPVDYDGEMPEGLESILWSFRTYTITGDDGISTFADNMLVGDVKDIFGLSLPSFMETDEILSSPLSQLGQAIDNMAVTNIFEEPETEDTIGDRILGIIFDMELPDEGNPGEFRPYRISEVSQLFADLPQHLLIQDILDEPEHQSVDSERTGTYDESATVSENIMYRLWAAKDGEGNPCTINDISEAVEDVLNELLIKDILDLPDKQSVDSEGLNYDTSATVSQNIMYRLWAAKDGNDDPYTINDISTAVNGVLNELLIRDILDLPDKQSVDSEGLNYDTSATASQNIMYRLWAANDGENPYTINDISTAVEEVLNDLTIRDFIDEPDPDESAGKRILYKIWVRNSAIDDMNEDILEVINDLTIADIFGTEGIFSLFTVDEGEDPIYLMELGTDDRVAESIANANLNDLVGAGIITEAQISNLSTDQRENVTLSAIIQIINNNSYLIPD